MAGFENRSIEEIKTLLINGFQREFNGKLRVLPKSFISVFSTVLAGVFIVLYKQIGWIFLQIFPETAYWGEVTVLGKRIRPLVKWGVLFGVGEPKTGRAWKGKVSVKTLEIGSVLIGGTQLKSDANGRIYLVDDSTPLANETETIAVSCSEAGGIGNLDIDDKVNFVNPLSFVEKETAVIETIQSGEDSETEQSYRNRVINRYRVQPQGGGLADYRIWAQEVADVLSAYPYKHTESPTGVILYVSANPNVYPDRIPTADLLRRVGDSCTYNPETGKATRKPLGAVLDPLGDGSYAYILPVSVTGFEVHIDGLIGVPAEDFASAVKPRIQEYFLGREPYIRGLSDDNNKTNSVSRNSVNSTVNQVSVAVKAEYGNVTLKKSGAVCPQYALRNGELAKLNALYIGGVLYE